MYDGTEMRGVVHWELKNLFESGCRRYRVGIRFRLSGRFLCEILTCGILYISYCCSEQRNGSKVQQHEPVMNIYNNKLHSG